MIVDSNVSYYIASNFPSTLQSWRS